MEVRHVALRTGLIKVFQLVRPKGGNQVSWRPAESLHSEAAVFLALQQRVQAIMFAISLPHLQTNVA